jgi:hypothetical protein
VENERVKVRLCERKIQTFFTFAKRENERRAIARSVNGSTHCPRVPHAYADARCKNIAWRSTPSPSIPQTDGGLTETDPRVCTPHAPSDPVSAGVPCATEPDSIPPGRLVEARSRVRRHFSTFVSRGTAAVAQPRKPHSLCSRLHSRERQSCCPPPVCGCCAGGVCAQLCADARNAKTDLRFQLLRQVLLQNTKWLRRATVRGAVVLGPRARPPQSRRRSGRVDLRSPSQRTSASGGRGRSTAGHGTS